VVSDNSDDPPPWAANLGVAVVEPVVVGPAIADAVPARTVAVASKAMPAVLRTGLRRGGAVLRRLFG
jgi:hypothetical protein